MVSKIDTFVSESVIDTREMKRLLKIIVKNIIFRNENLLGDFLISLEISHLPFPKSLYYTQSITHPKRNLCHFQINQEYLQEKIDQWETTGNSVKFFFFLKVLLNKTVMKVQVITETITIIIMIISV